MTNKDYTAVVLVVDRSGSMSSIAGTVESALQEFVNGQRQLDGDLTIDTVFFDIVIDNRATFFNPKKRGAKLDLAIRPGGMTSLYDAVGSKIDSFGKALAELEEEKRPGKVIFVIATDGADNWSKEYTQEAVAESIKHQRETYGWDFTFIGANQDAVLTAKVLNIPQGSALTFDATHAGAAASVRAMSDYVSATRLGEAAAYSASDRESAINSKDASATTITNPVIGKVATPRKRTPAKPKTTEESK